MRTLDRGIDDAISAAALTLLVEHGFARLTIEAVARAAGVGKPAIYRRFSDKVALVAHVISSQLPSLDAPDLGDSRAELWRAVEQGLPADGPSYVGLIGGLIAEQDRHPELIEAFRQTILLPRRATVRSIIERGQTRGEIRRDIDSEAALELMAGPFLARAFAGLDTGARWRQAAFETWWEILRERPAR
jgi:AcrR family transcriptional regulator